MNNRNLSIPISLIACIFLALLLNPAYAQINNKIDKLSDIALEQKDDPLYAWRYYKRNF